MKEIFRQSFEAWFILIKLTIPALIIVRLLMWFDLVGYFSSPFEPIMELMGLPKEMALVWVTAMLTNIYTGIVVYFNVLAITGPITVAQATILGAILLIAHNLPVESGVCRGAGVSPLRATTLRIGAAIVYGILIDFICRSFDIGRSQAGFIAGINTDPVGPWGRWTLDTLASLVIMFGIVTALLFLMSGMRRIGLIAFISRILSPLMRLAGIGIKATMITIFGMILGLAYGGGLIIAESRSGRVPKTDVYSSVTLMALCHSLLEDTILVFVAFGGSLWGLLIARLAFAVVLTGLIVRATRYPFAQGLLIGRKYIQ